MPSNKTNVPSSQSSLTSQYRRIRPLDNSFEEVNSNSQSEILLHGNESSHNVTPGTSSHLEHHSHGQGHDSLTSTEHCSFMSDLANPTIIHDDSTTPHTGCQASSTQLTAEKKDKSVSIRHPHICLLWAWKWEALSLATSLALLAAIVTILASYNHATHPEWPYNININSLISLFTTVMIAQLGFVLAEVISQLKWLWFNRPHPLQDLEHYDAASRGIMGAMLFLGHFSWHPRACLAACAAFILIVSAAIGPFTQQSVKSYACQRPLRNMSASLAAASRVDSGLTMDNREPNLKLITAALEGILGSENGSRTVPFDCPTGACDFPRYSSLGYCSSCVDVTSHVEEQFGPGPISYYGPETHDLNYTLPGEDCQLHYHVGNTTLSDSFWITSPGFPADLVICQSSRPGPFNTTIFSLAMSDCSQTPGGSSIDGAGCNNHPEQLPRLGNSSGLVALGCSIGLCVRDYTGRVRNGVLDETMTNRFPSSYQLDAGDDETTIVNLPCIVDSKIYDMSNVSQVLAVPGRESTTVIQNGERVIVPLECVFKVGRSTVSAVRKILQQVLGSGGCDMTPNYVSKCDPWYLEAVFRGGKFTAETISSDIDRIAVAISNQMRAVGSNAYRNGTGMALGTVIQTTVCVKVKWAWMILPIALVLLTLFLFVAVLLTAQQRHDGQPIWKSSAVVAFFHGIDAPSHTSGRVDGQNARPVGSAHGTEDFRPSSSLLKGESSSDLMSLESMHARAKEVVVRLDAGPTGRRGFVRVNDDEDGHLATSKKLESQRRSADSQGDGEVLGSAQPLRNSSRPPKASPYLQVDLGIELTPSIRSSLNGSNQQDVERRSEPEV